MNSQFANCRIIYRYSDFTGEIDCEPTCRLFTHLATFPFVTNLCKKRAVKNTAASVISRLVKTIVLEMKGKTMLLKELLPGKSYLIGLRMLRPTCCGTTLQQIYLNKALL